MDIETILVSASVGITSSIVTAYITTRLKLRLEKEKWDREFSVKYAEIHNQDKNQAQGLAKQFAIGVLIIDYYDSPDRERVFVPPHCRLIAGRSDENQIDTKDAMTSRQHTCFSSDIDKVYVEDLRTKNSTFLNGEIIHDKRHLVTGDTIKLGKTVISFKRL